MEEQKKQIWVHYIKEFTLILIGIIIFAGLFWYYKFEFNPRLIPIWIFIFNGVLMGYWTWQSNLKPWEKGILGFYFILVQIVILEAAR